jgi:hypothetical protein
VANSPSQDLNLQRGDRALHSSLQEWITQQSKCETTDQGNGKALPDLDDDTSRIRQSYFSPSVVSPESVVYPDHAPSGTSPEPSIAPQRANIREAGSRASVERRAFRTAIRGAIIVIAVAAGWQVYRDDQTKDLLKAWGHSLLNRSSAVLATTQPGSEIAAEPGSKLSDQAVTPSAPTSIAIREFPELQQQLQTIVSDLAALQRIVEQVASKQEQISRDVATLQATEQNISGRVSSLTQPTAVRVVQRRNVAKLVHSGTPKQSAAESLPVQTPTPETPAPVDRPPRPPLPLSTPPEEAPSSAH